MKRGKQEALLKKYFEGESDLKEERALRDQVFADGSFEDILFGMNAEEKVSVPLRYDQKIQVHKNKLKRSLQQIGWAAIFFGVLTVGYLLKDRFTSSNQIQRLAEIEDGLTAPLISDRLKTVFELEHQMVDEQLQELLLATLITEENTNVRLAIVSVLNTGTNLKVTKELSHNLFALKSPLLQSAMVDVLVRNIENLNSEDLRLIMENPELTSESKNRLEDATAL